MFYNCNLHCITLLHKNIQSCLYKSSNESCDFYLYKSKNVEFFYRKSSYGAQTWRTKCEVERQSPRTESCTAYMIFGSVLTWHSYLPESVFLALSSLRVQASLPGVCWGPNRASELNEKSPEVRIWRSLLLIQETLNQKWKLLEYRENVSWSWNFVFHANFLDLIFRAFLYLDSVRGVFKK